MTTPAPARQFASFQDLRLLAETSPVAHACIELRISEIVAADWDVKPRPGIAPDSGRREQALRFLRHIDPNYAGFSSWLRAAAREMLTADALAVHVDTGSVALMDGALIEPVPGNGVPCIGYLQRWHPAERGSSSFLPRPTIDDSVMGMYGANGALVYRVFHARPGALFGFPPLEQAMTCEDGTLDPEPSDAAILAAFGLPGEALGMLSVPAPAQPPDRDAWLAERMRWLASVIDVVLRKNQMPDMRFEFTSAG